MCSVPFIRKNIVVFHPEKIPFKNIFYYYNINTTLLVAQWPSFPTKPVPSEATHIHHTRNLKVSHLNGLQPSLMLSVTPVFFLLATRYDISSEFYLFICRKHKIHCSLHSMFISVTRGSLNQNQRKDSSSVELWELLSSLFNHHHCQ